MSWSSHVTTENVCAQVIGNSTLNPVFRWKYKISLYEHLQSSYQLPFIKYWHYIVCVCVCGGEGGRRVRSMCHRVCVHVEVTRQLEGVMWDLEVRWSGSAARAFNH